jgi:phenylalanyl-tRNA synthetase beta chain
MQISLKWINELVNIETIQIDDLIDKLTLGGFEVEEILEVEINQEKQIVLDISATANRSDSLSIQGISAEIIALLDQKPKISTYAINNLDWKQKVEKLSIIGSESDGAISTDFLIPKNTQNENYCSTLLAVVVANFIDTTTPHWIKEKLISSGIIPVNNLLDFQNYILLETGYPFAFYDFEKLSTRLNDSKFSLSLENAKNNQTFLANNDLEYNLDESNIVIKANNLSISIAGIIESKYVKYSELTNSLLIEGSIFNASNIRQQSRRLGLRTDRSARYEKSLKNSYLIESLYRLISLLRINNPNLTCKVHTVFKTNEPSLNSISLRYQTIKEILGPIRKISQTNFDYISPEIVTGYLERLNFQFSYNQSQLRWDVQIPHLRSDDITREIDLIEEIGRLHGFNNFLTTLPKIKTIGNEDLSYKTRKKITSCLLNLGLNELIHYSLVNETTNKKIELINPLLSDCSNLRTSLLPNLLETVKDNLKQGNSSIEGFEYGHVFSGDIETSFEEKEHVAGIFQVNKTKFEVSEMNHIFIWLEAKGKIEQLFRQLNLLIYWEIRSISTQENIFHPYQSGNVYLINGQKIGTFGQLHPLLANRLALPEKIYLFEFDMNIIQNQLQKNKLAMYKEYSLYPKITKDLSFIIRQDVPFDKLQEVLYLNGSQFLSEVKLLDEYRGQSIPEDYTSLCLQLIFQSNKKTLKNKDIESIMTDLQLVLTKKFDAIIRN